MTTTQLTKRLANIQSRLKNGITVTLNWDMRSNWECRLVTEHNNFPHWFAFGGCDFPGEAIAGVEGFLNGTVRDHAVRVRQPAAFLKEGGQEAVADV